MANGDLAFRGRFDRMELLSFRKLEGLVNAELAHQGIGGTETVIAFRRGDTFATVKMSDLVFKPKQPPAIKAASLKRPRDDDF
jgi:hypothetical protein